MEKGMFEQRLAAKEIAAAWVSRADYRDTRAEGAAGCSDGGLDVAWQACRMAASLLDLPRTFLMLVTNKQHLQLSKANGFGNGSFFVPSCVVQVGPFHFRPSNI